MQKEIENLIKEEFLKRRIRLERLENEYDDNGNQMYKMYYSNTYYVKVSFDEKIIIHDFVSMFNYMRIQNCLKEIHLLIKEKLVCA